MSTNSMLWWNPHLTSPSEQYLDINQSLSSWRHLCCERDGSDSSRSVWSNEQEKRNPYHALRYCFKKPNPSCFSQSTELGYWPPNSLLLYKPGGDLLRHSHPVSKGNENVRSHDIEVGKDNASSKPTDLLLKKPSQFTVLLDSSVMRSSL